MISLLYIDML